MDATSAQELLRGGRLAEALAAVEGQVREDPASAKQRIFLFQVLCILGHWDRAMTQLNVAADLDANALLMAQVCRSALNCEALRAEVFAGRRLPLVFGEPSEWVGLMVRANQLSAASGATGPAEAHELRSRAMEAAPAVAGAIGGQAFEWIADADSRLGPILEAVIGGKYFWVPFENIRLIEIDKPTDLRDLVWVPASFTWTNGGTAAGLIPVRYPGSETSEDPGIRMSRKTEWRPLPGGAAGGQDDAMEYAGLGQRMLVTDNGETPLLECRRITIGPQDAEPAGAP